MENTLKQKLAAGAQPIGTFFDTASVSLMECLGRTGLDFAIIDNEHSPIEAETTAALVRAAELSSICPIARVREISRPAVLKLLDVGVQGLIVPNVKTLEQVHALVDYAKYYPIGQRGFCPSRKDGWGFDGLGSVPETMRHFNGETLLFPQCETAEALAIIEDICAVDGVDGIFVGPFDLSISMGMPGQFDAPEFQAAITRIVAACRTACANAESRADADKERTDNRGEQRQFGKPRPQRTEELADLVRQGKADGCNCGIGNKALAEQSPAECIADHIQYCAGNRG